MIFTALLAAGIAISPRAGEDRLRAWLETDVSLSRRLAAVEDAPTGPIAYDPELRDSVSDAPSLGDLRRRIEESETNKRRALAAKLPGMDEPNFATCLTLGECAQPPLTVEVDDRAHLRAATRALIRPWLLLQKARGGWVKIEAARKDGQLVIMSLPELGRKVAIKVEPKIGGGYRVWFEDGLALAHLFGVERDAALR
jgi:hypothetical protein